MEALAQLRCIDARSAGPAVQLAVSTSRSLEEGQHLAVGQLGQLARIMQSVAIIAGGHRVLSLAGSVDGARPALFVKSGLFVWRAVCAILCKQGARQHHEFRICIHTNAATLSVVQFPNTHPDLHPQLLAATATVPPPTLLAATAAWHLLVVRAEALAQEQEQAAPGGQLGSPHLGLALSRMWCASKMLMAVVKANSAPSFRLPDRLG